MKKFNYNIILVSMGLLSLNMAHADSMTEVEQLRNEVKQLREMIEQQQQVQNKQIVALENNVKAAQVVSQAKDQSFARTKAGAEVTLYGNIRADLLYQSEGGSADRLYNQINSVPLKGHNESSDQLKSTLAATRLGLDFKTADKNVSGKIEVDFLGANDALRIRHAYFNYGQWLIGQTWSNFAIPDYMPETIDALGYVGGSVKRTPQVRYSYTIQPGSQLVVAAEDPKDSTVQARLPALTARWNQKIGDDLNMSLRTMAHEKRIESNEEWSWGVGLGAKYDFTPQTSLKADYYHVKGDSSFVSWANSGVVKQGSEIVALSEFDSITVGVAQKINDKTRATLGYGYMKFKEDQTYIAASPQANKELWQAWVNVFYSPVKPISFGLEYVYGEREVFTALEDGTKKGEDNRVSMLAQYNF